MVKHNARRTKNDKRYTITLEYCGQATARHIVRFCDDFVGAYRTAFAAGLAADLHDEGRMAQYAQHSKSKSALP